MKQQSQDVSTSGLEFSRDEFDENLLVRFERIVARQPGHMAISGDGVRLTYEELNRRVNQLAHAILKHTRPGVGCIAYLAAHSPDMVICALAALKAAKAYLCVHPGLPVAAQREIIADATPDLLLAAKLFEPRAGQIVAGSCDVVALEEIDDLDAAENPCASVTPSDPAAIFYTSGSTGRPKGVAKSHRTMLHRAWLSAEYDAICPADRQSLLTYCSFASSESDIFGALLNGATVSLFDLGARGLRDFSDWIGEEQITVLHPPVMWFRRLLATLQGENLFPSVRLVALAGETVVASDIARWRRHFARSCALRHRFSSTEAGLLAVACIEPDSVITPGVVPACHPVADKLLSLQDELGRPVQPGEAGELTVNSAYLADGYWHRPSETAERFWKDSDSPHQRVFRTGDWGRMLSDGGFEFLGRRDNQVKIRGYRVEAREVEDAVLRLPSIDETAVVAYEAADETRLAAYVVMQEGWSFQPESLRHSLRSLLPEWKVPARIVALDALPLTPTGKIDRAAIPVPNDSRPPQETRYLPPGTPTEEKLASIWSELLGLDQVGIHDDFFALGGHSLLATRVNARIASAFQVDLPLSTMFDAPTIAELSSQIDELRRGEIRS